MVHSSVLLDPKQNKIKQKDHSTFLTNCIPFGNVSGIFLIFPDLKPLSRAVSIYLLAVGACVSGGFRTHKCSISCRVTKPLEPSGVQLCFNLGKAQRTYQDSKDFLDMDFKESGFDEESINESESIWIKFSSDAHGFNN